MRTKDDEILRWIAHYGGAANLRSLWMPPEDPAAFALLSEMEFPLVEDLLLPSARVLQGPGRETWLRRMPSMSRLRFGSTEVNDALVEALATLPWWRQLRFLEGRLSPSGLTGGWGRLWEDSAFEEIRMCYPTKADGQSFLQYPHPQLRVLSFCGQTGDAFLETLAGASLPLLEDLDLRFTQLTEAGVRAFVAAPRAGLPSLRRMGISFVSNRREEYYDWTGVWAGAGYEQMTTEELENAFFAGSSLRLMPEISGWPDKL